MEEDEVRGEGVGCMNVLDRLKNAYAGGGLREIARKSFFHCIYRINNYKTKFIVNHKKIEYGLNTTEAREKKVIVSLTSFPPRFANIQLTLKSLLLQSQKPDRIIVYLGSDSSREQFTNEMLELEQYGVEYHIDGVRNLKSHKKYFYAMQEFPDDVVVTADDDVYYPSNWLSGLLKSYKKFPKAVSARRVHLMKKNREELALYNYWEDQCRRVKLPSFSLIATGCSGILYPPHCFKPETFDEATFKELCFDADDIWLKCMEVLNDVPVVWVKNWEVDLLDVADSTKGALSSLNVDYRKNDAYLHNVMDHFKIPVENFFR